MLQRKQWSDLSRPQRGLVIALVAVQAAFLAFAQRDLSTRSEAEVRGPKALWRVLTFQIFGAIAYVLIGRKPRLAPAAG